MHRFTATIAVGFALATAALAAITAAPASAAPLPAIPLGFQGAPSVSRDWGIRPADFSWADDPENLYAGPAGSVVHPQRIAWSEWTAGRAEARAYFWTYDYSETASGQSVFKITARYPVDLHFSRPETVRGRRVFTRFYQHFTQKTPRGEQTTSTVKLSCGIGSEGLAGLHVCSFAASF